MEKNIIIKGTDISRRIKIVGKERGKWIKKFIKEKLGVEYNIVLLEDKWNSNSRKWGGKEWNNEE